MSDSDSQCQAEYYEGCLVMLKNCVFGRYQHTVDICSGA